MKITFNSELMENQKHAVVMAPDLAFEVLQSQDGEALFFSIGTDNILYLTREQPETSTGWSQLDLSSALSAQHDGAAVAAKAFSVTQNAKTLAIDLALVLTVGGADFLYLSQGNANTDEAWASGVTWTAIPFDAENAPSPFTIADVLLMNIPGDDGAVENIFVDILRDPGDGLNLLDRYYLAPGGTPQWNRHQLAADMAAGSISSCLGQRASDPLPGIYTFGTIGGEAELLFTPQYNYFRPTVPPDPARLTVPAGASAIASALNGAGVSNLFVAGTEGLFLFTPDNQHDQATAVQIVSSAVVAGASSLAAATDARQTAVWGVNPQGCLFYVTCPVGSEADATAWSSPVPLLDSVEGFAFFLNLNAGNNVLFAHVDAQSLVQLTQDPVTTDWLQRAILLPATRSDDVAVYQSFITHIQVTDDGGIAAPSTAVAVTATSPVSVYLNNVYYRLSPTVAVNTTTDETGVLTVVQEAQTLAAVCFRVVLTDTPDVVADINPMSKALATLGTIQSGEDLGNVQITNADGTQQPLVPASVSSEDKDAVAQSLGQFMKLNAGLPQDGSRQGATPAPNVMASARASPTALPRARGWGLSFSKGGLAYHEGEDLARRFSPRAAAAGSTPMAVDAQALGDIGSSIAMAAGDFFHWVKRIYDDVESFVVQEAEGVYHFLATIAGQVYDVLLDCTQAVIHAVEFVFNKISVFFEDLIKWLGFLFDWSDILRTHRVLKNIFNQYVARCVSNLGNARARMQSAFTDVEKFLDAWAGVADNIPSSLSGITRSSALSSSPPVRGLDSPQGNWGLYQLKSNAASSSTAAQPGKGLVGDIVSLLQPLADALEREKDVFQAACGSFKSDIIDKVDELSVTQLMKALIAIITDALLESVENVLLAAIDVLTALSDGIQDFLNATLDIPIISSLYKKLTGDDLSLLDLACLVAAIPVTLGYKLITDAQTPPFPDDDTTTALINAPDFASIQKLFTSTRAMVARAAVPLAPAASIPASVNKSIVLSAGIASAVGSVGVTVFSLLKQKNPACGFFSVANGIFYLFYVAPDIVGQIPDLQDKKWWAITNEVITDVMTVKALVDAGVGLMPKALEGEGAPEPQGASKLRSVWEPISPWVDYVGNIAWQVPTSAALCDPENQNLAGALSFGGGTCFDLSGVMAPLVANDEEPGWVIAATIVGALNLAYGGLSCASSVLTFKS
jgi:hypothetical protein